MTRKRPKRDREQGETGIQAESFIDLPFSTRQELRAQKQFALADKIRNGLAAQGVTIEDTPKGARWKYERGKQ